MTTLKVPDSAQPFKDKIFSLGFLKEMVRARALEEKLIKMMRTGDGYFWIGGPGEEAFSISLGLQVEKGQGVAYDFLHLHYRSNGVALAMGEPMISFLRQMKNVGTDPFSGGRNFVSHICKKEWNIVPVTSTIETQYTVAPGTARAQRAAKLRGEKAGITIVVGGDAGTAEGDFASALVWSSRPGEELPMLMIVTNNHFGISTPANTQHGEKLISDRAKAFGISSAHVDGMSVEKTWKALGDAMEYVRTQQKPFLLEVFVSRLNGHSSSSGAARVSQEECPVELFAKKLIKQGWIDESNYQKWIEEATNEANDAHNQVRNEKYPNSDTIWNFVYADDTSPKLPGRNS